MRTPVWLCLGMLLSAVPIRAEVTVLKGRLAVARGDEIPRSLEVRIESAPQSGDGPKASIPCKVKESFWTCSVPAGVHDLRFKAGGYAPVYTWGIRVDPSRAVDLGTLRLRRGASLAGQVETEEGTVPAPPCKVEITPFQADTPDVVAGRRLASLTREARVNERGFFQFEAVPPGQYRVTVTKPGWAPASLGPFEVRPNLEARMIDRIVLARPVTFQVALDPPLDPYGQPWKLRLAASAPRTETFEGTASSEGNWARGGLFPGSYHLKVLSDPGMQWVSEDVEVRAGRDPLKIEIPVVEIEGKVTRGKEPLAATLWFGGVSGTRRLRFDSDEKGRFRGHLPQEGAWPVQLAIEEGDVRVSLDPVEVHRLSGQRSAKVEIAVPDTTLTGEVVDESGRPAPAVEVWVNNTGKVRRGEDNRFHSDSEGKFRIRGLAAGPTALRAEEGERTSEWAEVSLEEGQKSPWMRLVLRSNLEIRGRIVSPSGAVPGARVLGMPEIGVVGASASVSTVTDPTGEFTFSVPGDTHALNLLIFAPGFALRMTKAPVTAGTPLEIPVEPQGGTLVLELPSSGDSTPMPLLAHGGTFFPALLLAPWARLQGLDPGEPGHLVLPNLELGDWTLCVGGAGTLRQGGKPPADKCTSGFLLPKGELRLKAPM